MIGGIFLSDEIAPFWLAGFWLPIPPLAVGFGEIPGGTIDGMNTVFTIQAAPSPNSLQLVRGIGVNGLGELLLLGVHYTLADKTITYLVPYLPLAGDWHRVWYRQHTQ